MNQKATRGRRAAAPRQARGGRARREAELADLTTTEGLAPLVAGLGPASGPLGGVLASLGEPESSGPAVGHDLGRIDVFPERPTIIPFTAEAFHVAPADADAGEGGGGGAVAAANEPLRQARAPEGEEEATDGGAAGDGASGEVLSVEEDFVPEESQIQTDDGLQLQVVQDDQAGSGGESGAAAAPPAGFLDLGRTGTVRYGDPTPPGTERQPHAFTDGGMTGTGPVHWGGGTGGRGNQGVGSIQAQVAPVYESRGNGLTSNSDAWVKAGTGTVQVTRSWVGVNSGDQGNGYFITPAAAARLNSHETLHVTNTKGHHDSLIVPLEARIAASAASGKGLAWTQSGAIDALRAIIKWPETLRDFQTHDTTDNQPPSGTVDSTDLASGTYPVDVGPGTVGGTPVMHRVRMPGEPTPA
jgi:hypothetical protein